jgi:hypothetical protein
VRSPAAPRRTRLCPHSCNFWRPHSSRTSSKCGCTFFRHSITQLSEKARDAFVAMRCLGHCGSAAPPYFLFPRFLGEFGLLFHHLNFASLRAGSAHSGEQNFCPFSDLKKYGAAQVGLAQ